MLDHVGLCSIFVAHSVLISGTFDLKSFCRPNYQRSVIVAIQTNPTSTNATGKTWYVGYAHPSQNGNPYNGYVYTYTYTYIYIIINPYQWIDDHHPIRPNMGQFATAQHIQCSDYDDHLQLRQRWLFSRYPAKNHQQFHWLVYIVYCVYCKYIYIYYIITRLLQQRPDGSAKILLELAFSPFPVQVDVSSSKPPCGWKTASNHLLIGPTARLLLVDSHGFTSEWSVKTIVIIMIIIIIIVIIKKI